MGAVELGPQWWDVDTASDLDRLIGAADLPKHTARVLHERGIL